MAKKTTTIRLPAELEEAIEKELKKKTFKNKTEAIVIPLKKIYKIKK